MGSGGAIAFSPPGLSCLYTTSLSLLLLLLLLLFAVYLFILSISYCLFLFFLRRFAPLSQLNTSCLPSSLFSFRFPCISLFLRLTSRFSCSSHALFALLFLCSAVSASLTFAKTLQCCIVKPLGQLVWVSSTAHTAYTPHLSTSSSSTTLTDSLSGRTHLGASFVLRCFQHLSLPHLATQQCFWRNNWNTSGAFTPVLSY